MSTYTKEKNLIIFQLDDNRTYTLDINKGELYGKTGKPLKTCPVGELRRAMSNHTQDNHLIYHLYRNLASSTENLRQLITAFQGCEVATSLNIPVDYLYADDYTLIGQNGKIVAKYIKEHPLDTVRFDMYNLRRYIQKELDKAKYSSVIDNFNEEQWDSIRHWVSRKVNTLFTAQDFSVMDYYLNKQKMWEYCRSTEKLMQYLDMCKVMEKEPQKVSNFMREYVETKNSYFLYKDELDAKRIALNYKQHESAWQFKYGEFEIVIPTCTKDLVVEGNKMHHCVGGYGDRIIRGECYICFVRKSNDINTPYITCQVKNDGTINQYYLAYDRCIRNDEDIAFRREFQKHLLAVWGN